MIAITKKQKVEVTSVVLPFSRTQKKPTEQVQNKVKEYLTKTNHRAVIVVDEGDIGRLSIIAPSVLLVDTEVEVKSLEYDIFSN